ncbi:MAG: metallophosphoesterase family protein [Planctomycetota bacterium]
MPVEIGIISDTHGFFDPRLPKIFKSVDEIWHAGDFGGGGVAEKLKAIKPMRGVFGNIDTGDIRSEFPEDLFFELEGVKIWMTHIAGRPRRYDPRVKKILSGGDVPDLLVCGHSHMLRIEQDKQFKGLQTINPGAAGHHGFHQVLTLLKCTIDSGQVKNIRVIELGPRGRKKA